MLMHALNREETVCDEIAGASPVPTLCPLGRIGLEKVLERNGLGVVLERD